MQWNCPHCGVTLAVADETLGTGWSFSRCYKCGGFALIRKSEINIIKVDKAPPGERIILPEASKNPSIALMGKEASQKLAKHMNQKISKSETTENSNSSNTSPPPFLNSQKKIDLSEMGSNLENKTSKLFENIPDPLPEIPEDDNTRMIPYGIAATACLVLLSGSYLFIQGQSLYKKTHILNVNEEELSGKQIQSATHQINTETNSNGVEKKLVAALTPPIVIDQVQQSAMAPLKLNQELNSPGEVGQTPLQKNNLTSSNDLKPQPISTLFVRVRLKKVNLHSGPGMSYPIVGSATPEYIFNVSDWSERWFQISLKSDSETKTLGWIRNDLVQTVGDKDLVSGSGITAPNINPLR